MPFQCWTQGFVRCRDNFIVKFLHKKFVSDEGICRKSGCQLSGSDRKSLNISNPSEFNETIHLKFPLALLYYIVLTSY